MERIVAAAHEAGEKLRVVGSALSPNGIGLSDEGMLSMALLDNVLAVDKDKGQVGAGGGGGLGLWHLLLGWRGGVGGCSQRMEI